MNQYLLKVVLFALLVVTIFGGWSAMLVYMELSAYEREAKLPEGISCVVCGGSETRLGLEPAVWPGFFNFATDGITLDQMELKMIDLFERNTVRPKAVLIDVSPRKLIVQDLSEPLIESDTACKRFMLHVLHPKQSRRPLNGLPVIFRDVILVNRTKKAWKALRKGKPYESSIGGLGCPNPRLTEEGVASNRAKILSKKPICGFKDHLKHTQKRINDQAAELTKWWKINGKMKDSAETVDCIRNMISMVKANGVKPILITPPWHSSLRDRIEPDQLADYYATMRKIAADEDINYLDYLRQPFPEDEWKDGNHLNTYGAVRFTEIVRKEVEEILRF